MRAHEKRHNIFSELRAARARASCRDDFIATSRRRFDAARGNDTIAPIGGRHWGVRDGISFVYALNRDHGVHSRRENHECSRREPTADQKLA